MQYLHDWYIYCANFVSHYLKVCMNHSSGFVLLEVLIAISIAIILLTSCVPIIKTLFDNQSERILQDQLVKALEIARREAHALHRIVGLCRSNDNKVCTDDGRRAVLIFIDETNNGMIRNVQQILTVVQLTNYSGKLNWRSFPEYRHYIAFSPSVLSESDNGSLWYCRQNKTFPAWAIVLNKQGQTHVLDQQTITSNLQPYPCQ